jgi:hypothetical protein
MKYFIRQFIIYLLVVGGFTFIIFDKTIDSMNGKEMKSTVKFVYEAF